MELKEAPVICRFALVMCLRGPHYIILLGRFIGFRAEDLPLGPRQVQLEHCWHSYLG